MLHGWITFSDGSRSKSIESRPEAKKVIEEALAENKILQVELRELVNQILGKGLPTHCAIQPMIAFIDVLETGFPMDEPESPPDPGVLDTRKQAPLQKAGQQVACCN